MKGSGFKKSHSTDESKGLKVSPAKTWVDANLDEVMQDLLGKKEGRVIGADRKGERGRKNPLGKKGRKRK